MTTFTADDLVLLYKKMTARATAHCRLTTSLVGGISADRAGIEAFVRHQLKLEGDAAEQAVNRILKDEIGEHNVTPAEGEVQERLSYGVKVLRRDAFGPWLGDWMVKACIKTAGSRLGYFKTKLGSKGAMVEAGQVRAIDGSLAEQQGEFDPPRRVHFYDGTTGQAVQTAFEQIKGRISSPAGAASIVTDCETVPAGSRFSFEYRWFGDSKLKTNDIANIFALAMVIGVGSAKAFERGKFRVEKLEVEEYRAA